MTFIYVFTSQNIEAAIDTMDKATRDWEIQAARGDCSWVCSDCCVSFPDGMPDACVHGHQSCTDIIHRDKRQARAEGGAA